MQFDQVVSEEEWGARRQGELDCALAGNEYGELHNTPGLEAMHSLCDLGNSCLTLGLSFLSIKEG